MRTEEEIRKRIEEIDKMINNADKYKVKELEYMLLERTILEWILNEER